MYSVDGLEHGIERCRINIDTLEKAIDTERNTIKNYRFMLDEIATAERQKAAADKGLTIDMGGAGDDKD